MKDHIKYQILFKTDNLIFTKNITDIHQMLFHFSNKSVV